MRDDLNPDETFRRPFRSWLGLDVRTGLILLVVFSAVRFALVMQANVTKNYGLVSLLFVAMALAPLILLTRSGRRRIGIRPPSPLGLVAGLVVGMACCILMAVSAGLLFGAGDANAFVYVAGTYAGLPDPMDDQTRLILFLVFALIGMSFSPIGEELFYRGLVHETFVQRLGERRAALVDAGAFALVHLSHFGLVWGASGWRLLPGPALWWVVGLFATALVFTWARRISRSVFGAVAAHAGFNLIMTAWTFYGVLA